MKIAIISDSHDNLPNINKALAYIKKENIQTIIHCGDICSRSILKNIAENFSGDIYWVLGNVHGVIENMKQTTDKYDNLHYCEDIGELEIDGHKIAFNHFPDEGKKLAQLDKYDYVFYGHTHKPWEETFGKTKLVNPGTLGGVFYKPSFAVLDTATNNLELKILDII